MLVTSAHTRVATRNGAVHHPARDLREQLTDFIAIKAVCTPTGEGGQGRTDVLKMASTTQVEAGEEELKVSQTQPVLMMVEHRLTQPLCVYQTIVLQQLQNDVKIRLSDPLELPSNNACRLFAVSNSRGLCAVATRQGFACHPLEQLRDAFLSAKPHSTNKLDCSVNVGAADVLGSSVTFIRFADSDSRIVVGTSSGVVGIWQTGQLLAGDQVSERSPMENALLTSTFVLSGGSGDCAACTTGSVAT